MTHVTGPVVLPDGTPAKSRAVLFKRTEDALFALPEGTVVPEIVTARTDAAGAIDVDLLPGAYVVTVPIRQGSVSADIVVPDAAEAVFATLVTNGAIPDAKPAWFDAAIEGATVSVEFPPGEPGQVLGYGPDGSVQAVAGGGYDDSALTARVAASSWRGRGMPPEMVAGTQREAVTARRHDALSTFGLLSDASVPELRGYVREVLAKQTGGKPLEAITLARWREVTGVILDGAWICARAWFRAT